MKTIIISIFLCTCMAWGQGKPDSIWQFKSKPIIMSEVDKEIENIYQEHQNEKDLFIGKSLVRLWDSYAKECYNDSSVSTIERFVDKMTPANKDSTAWWGYTSIEIDTIWIHTKKPTFPGFIEWMKKK